MAGSKGLFPIKAIFNIGKKFIDVIDDIWNALRPVLPMSLIDIVSPYLIGSVGFITHFGEGLQGARDAYHAFQNKAIGQRKTRLFTLALTVLFSALGLSTAFVLIAEAAGAAVSGAVVTVAPILIPGLLAGIYALSLWRNAYIYHRLKEDETEVRQAYQTCFSEGRSIKLKLQLDQLKEARLQMECKLAFNAIEVLSSSFVLAGNILGMAALVGASLGTFGALPMALILTGVVGGVACKLFEYVDESHEFAFTRGLRAWFLKGLGMVEIKDLEPPGQKNLPQVKPETSLPASTEKDIAKKSDTIFSFSRQVQAAAQPLERELVAIESIKWSQLKHSVLWQPSTKGAGAEVESLNVPSKSVVQDTDFRQALKTA